MNTLTSALLVVLISAVWSQEDGLSSCPEYIPAGYKIWSSDGVVGYACYPGYVMTPNVVMLYYHLQEIGDLNRAYFDTYNVAVCDFEATQDEIHLPSCLPPEQVMEEVHCGLPNYIENGRAVEFYFPGATEEQFELPPLDGKGLADLQMRLLPMGARYECDKGYMMMNTSKGDWGWCRESGGMNLPYCMPEDEAFTITYKLHAGRDKSLVDKKKGVVMGGIAMAMTEYAGATEHAHWELAVKEGSNNFAAGAICRTLGFRTGEHIEVNKKMMDGIREEFHEEHAEDKDTNSEEFDLASKMGWTNFRCSNDDTLPWSRDCHADRYEDWAARVGVMRSRVFPFDLMAVRCYDSSSLSTKISVQVRGNKIICGVQVSKRQYNMRVSDLGEPYADLYMDDTKLDPEQTKFHRRKGFMAAYNGDEYQCLRCKVWVGEELLGEEVNCKGDATDDDMN